MNTVFKNIVANLKIRTQITPAINSFRICAFTVPSAPLFLRASRKLACSSRNDSSFGISEVARIEGPAKEVR
jgi:hypothetical protein